MAFFSKNTGNEENKTPRNPSSLLTFRVLAVGYVAYLCVQMVKTYTAGGPDAPSLPMLIGGLVLLGGGAVILAVLSYREWKRNKPVYDQAMADLRVEAEAKRALEEAEEAEDAEDAELDIDDVEDASAPLAEEEDPAEDMGTEETDAPAEQTEE